MFNEQPNQEKFLASTISSKSKRNNWGIFLVVGVLLLLGGLSSVIWFKLQQNKLKANAAKSQNLLSEDPINSLVLAIYTTGQNKRLTKIVPWTKVLNPVQFSLRQAIDTAEESHLFQHEDSVHSVCFSTLMIDKLSLAAMVMAYSYGQVKANESVISYQMRTLPYLPLVLIVRLLPLSLIIRSLDSWIKKVIIWKLLLTRKAKLPL